MAMKAPICLHKSWFLKLRVKTRTTTHCRNNTGNDFVCFEWLMREMWGIQPIYKHGKVYTIWKLFSFCNQPSKNLTRTYTNNTLEDEERRSTNFLPWHWKIESLSIYGTGLCHTVYFGILITWGTFLYKIDGDATLNHKILNLKEVLSCFCVCISAITSPYFFLLLCTKHH